VLYLVRHGRTDANASGLLLGRLDPPLDPVGQEQAAAVAGALAQPNRLGSEPTWRVVTSPLQRTRQTAEIIAVRLGVPVEVDERWIELDYGELDGMPLSDVPAELWSAWRRDPGFEPPGGESLRTLRARVSAALAALADHCRDGGVVVVSHVSPIKAAVAWALGVGDEVTWRLFVSPGSISTVAIGPQGPVLRGFNVTPGP
jgi:broad specificity phosphatase PhoE